MSRPRGSGSLFLRGNTWWIQYFVGSERVRESTQTTDRDQAERILHRKLGSPSVPERVSVGDLLDLVMDDYKFRGLRSAAVTEWRADANLRPKLGKVLASKLTQREVRRYVEERREANAADATINRELAILRRGFTLARQQDPPLVSRALHIPKLAEDNVRQGFLEPDQYIQVLNELPERLKALFVVGYHLGCRKGELLKVRWDQVDLDAEVIRLVAAQTKSKRPRVLPIYGDMRVWLERQRESCPAGCKWVFHYRGGKVGSHLDGWAEACERAGVSGLLFHDLRRSAVRNMKRAGIQDKIAMEISGHRTRAIFDRYNIVDEGDLGDAGKKLEDYLRRMRKAKFGVVRKGSRRG